LPRKRHANSAQEHLRQLLPSSFGRNYKIPRRRVAMIPRPTIG
jgi:hypothetical protein